MDTNNADRDAHLRSTGLFDVETRPTMQYVSQRIEPFESGYLATGLLTLKGPPAR